MPFAVDEDAMSQKPGSGIVIALDPAKPPVKPIPYMEYPRVVYMHPKEPFRKVEHRNAQHEIVQIETVPAEHLSKLVKDEKELKEAMKQGWVKEPYVSKPAIDPNADLYATA